MAYEKVNWENDVTEANENTLGQMDQGIKDNSDDISDFKENFVYKQFDIDDEATKTITVPKIEQSDSKFIIICGFYADTRIEPSPDFSPLIEGQIHETSSIEAEYLGNYNFEITNTTPFTQLNREVGIAYLTYDYDTNFDTG